MNRAYEIIKRPIITEKALKDVENKVYVFEVEKGVNKTHVKEAIESLYEVQVAKVNVQNTKAKPKRVGKYAGYRSGYRKATVTLKKDSKPISAFEEN
ncbi:MAG: 50S ribosomal protein L23 [Mycoplasmatales bacterium]